VRQPRRDDDAWGRLVDLYTPLIRGWLDRFGVDRTDHDDLTQEVLGVLFREMPDFEHNQRPGAFRCWLRTITTNRIRAFWKNRGTVGVGMADSGIEQKLAELEDPAGGMSALWNREHDQYVLRRLLEMVRKEFTSSAWKAFQCLALEGKPAAEVAAEMGTTPNAVLLAKSRVLRRLREEARGLVD
jgi:RNA polymerase sigma-70 factor (ECF subfamily)